MLTSEAVVEKVADGVTEAMITTLFRYLKETYEEEKDKKAFKDACEGIKSEHIEERLKSIADAFSDELSIQTIYTKEELRIVFDKYYNEYILCGISKQIDEDTREELWKRFILFAPKWMEKYNKSISFGEKRILEVSRDTHKMVNELVTKGVDKQLLKTIAAEQSKLLNQLCENINIPFVDINKLYGIKISRYESKYTFYENSFAFDAYVNEGRGIDKNEDTYVLRLLLKNIGRTNIENIGIDNIQVEYIKEIDYDKPEREYSILPVMAHSEQIDNNINILPYGEEFIQCIITDRSDEFVSEEQKEMFVTDYEFNRLFVMFDVWLQGKEKQGYKYILFLSKRINQTSEDITGEYDIDYSAFTIIKS